jgi:hypothetical protein
MGYALERLIWTPYVTLSPDGSPSVESAIWPPQYLVEQLADISGDIVNGE